MWDGDGDRYEEPGTHLVNYSLEVNGRHRAGTKTSTSDHVIIAHNFGVNTGASAYYHEHTMVVRWDGWRLDSRLSSYGWLYLQISRNGDWVRILDKEFAISYNTLSSATEYAEFTAGKKP